MHTLAVADSPAGSPLRTPRDRRRAFDSQTGAPFGERALSKSHCGHEQGWQALAPVTAATGEIPEQYRRARPSERATAASTWPGLRCLLDGPTNTGGLRAGGNYEEGASSDHRRPRHPDPGNVHRRTISSRRLRGELGPLANDPRPKPQTLQQNPAMTAWANANIRGGPAIDLGWVKLSALPMHCCRCGAVEGRFRPRT
jgi:hypothetical protein